MGKMSSLDQIIAESEEIKARLYNPPRTKQSMSVRLDILAESMKITASELQQYSPANATELLGAANQINDWARQLRGDTNE